MDFHIVAGAVLLVLLAVNYLWRQKSTKYSLPPGPRRNSVLGNLKELIYSSYVEKEPPFVKFAKWAFQVNPI